MSWFSYIFPQKLLEASSRYNKHIRLNEERGKLKLLVNGSRQSGEYVVMLWQGALNAFRLPSSAKKILVLGVGGGSVIHILSSMFPKAHITGVDIDQTILEIAQKYFHLDKLPRLTLVHADAGIFVTKQTHKMRYDLVLVDTFVGPAPAPFVTDKEFLTAVNALMVSHGLAIINYLREPEYVAKAGYLKETLVKTFSSVQSFDIAYNRFFAARK